MKGVAVLVFLSACVALASAGNIVCVFTSWTIYRPDDGEFEASYIDPNLCTHVVYTYVGLNNESSTLDILDNWEVTGLDEFTHLLSLKEQNPDLKILVSMGGFNEASETYSEVAADPDKRAALVESVVSFIDENQFDGFDLNWQFPGIRGGDPLNDATNFVTLLGELKAALAEKDYILSVTVSGYVGYIDTSYPDGAAVSDNVDLINVMSFDYHGSWDSYVGHNAPLYPSSNDVTEEQLVHNVAAGIQYWIDNGADPKKINVGIGAYGRSFTLEDPENAELYDVTTGGGEEGPFTQESGILGYNEICALDADEWEYVWDDEQKVPHIVNGDQWIGYDNVESIEEKIQYANEQGLGGAFFWTLDIDDFRGLCGNEKFPLLKVINDNLD